MQAQDAAAAALAVRARSPGLVYSDIESARLDDHSIIRTWMMRGTLHLVAAEDVGWLLALLAPLFIRSNRGRRAELGLDEETGMRGLRILHDQLDQQDLLTRADIRKSLSAHGIPSAGQATIHLIQLAALHGLLCYGPNQGSEPTFVRMEGWVERGDILPPEQALVELVRRYLAAYSPAAAEDFSAWSGLPLRRAREAWSQLTNQLIEVKIGDAPAYMLQEQSSWLEPEPPSPPVVNLLPAFDTYLLGYRNRDLALEPQHARRIYPGGGILHPALVVNGQVAGRWKIKRFRDRIEIILEPFEGLTSEEQKGLDREVEDLAHFLGTEARLTVSAV